MKFGLRHIRYFAMVAEELNFRRAASRLGIAQPAVSRAIRDLEEDLGVALLIRNNRYVQITNAGQRFLEGSLAIMQSIDRTIDQTQRAHLGQVGSLRIGYTDNAIAGTLPGLLKTFRNGQPDIVLSPFHGPTVEQLRRLEQNEIDVGFVTGPIGLSGYEQVPIEEERFVCVTYSGHPFARRCSIRLAELADEHFVHGSSNEWKHFHAYLFPLCRREGFIPRIVQEAFNTAGILGLVASEMGVTVLTENATLAMPPGLRVIPISDINEELKTVAIWKSDAIAGPKNVFAEFLRTWKPPSLQ